MVSFAALIAYSFEVTGRHPFVLTGKIEEGLPPLQAPPFSVTTDNKTISFSEMVQVSMNKAETAPAWAGSSRWVSQESGKEPDRTHIFLPQTPSSCGHRERMPLLGSWYLSFHDEVVFPLWYKFTLLRLGSVCLR